jgi:hypothetical protein
MEEILLKRMLFVKDELRMFSSAKQRFRFEAHSKSIYAFPRKPSKDSPAETFSLGCSSVVWRLPGMGEKVCTICIPAFSSSEVG